MDDPAAVSPPSIPFWRRLRGEVALSLAATLLSLCAVANTAWQTAIMREQLRASVWPRLQIVLRLVGENESQYFRIHLDNVGVGPAIITDVRISYRGKPFPSVARVFSEVMREHAVARSAINTLDNNDPEPEMVVPQQQGLVMLLARGRGAEAADLILAAKPHLQIAIQYASIYGEVWEVTFPDRRLRRVGWRKDL